MTIHDDKHPRGQADNAGQFRDKGNSAPEAVLAHYAAESGTGWISPFVEQVNSKWQVAAVLGAAVPVSATRRFLSVPTLLPAKRKSSRRSDSRPVGDARPL